MNYILSRPCVVEVYTLLPRTQKALIIDSTQSNSVVRDVIKLLLATKEAYVSGWKRADPIIAVGDEPNAPRPTPEQLLFNSLERKRQEGHTRGNYHKEYYAKNKEARAKYARDNRERINANVRARREIARQLAAGALAVKDDAPKTNWRTV